MNFRTIPLPEIAPGFLNARRTDVDIRMTLIYLNLGMEIFGNYLSRLAGKLQNS